MQRSNFLRRLRTPTSMARPTPEPALIKSERNPERPGTLQELRALLLLAANIPSIL